MASYSSKINRQMERDLWIKFNSQMPSERALKQTIARPCLQSPVAGSQRWPPQGPRPHRQAAAAAAVQPPSQVAADTSHIDVSIGAQMRAAWHHIEIKLNLRKLRLTFILQGTKNNAMNIFARGPRASAKGPKH